MMNSSVVEPAVAVSDLVVARGKNEVLHGITFELAPGTITGLMGPSGCGKTTLMRSLVGVQHISGGTTQVLGRDPRDADLRHELGYVTQAVSVYRDLTVAQNTRYFAALHGARPAEADRAIETVGLGAYAGRRIESLSGGQASRASLACALVGTPSLLVLDEPTVGLDPVTREDLWGALRALADDGVTMLVSSHVMDEALRCDRLLLMRSGRIIADTTPRRLLDDTGTADAEAAFLAIIERDTGDRAATRRSRREEER